MDSKTAVRRVAIDDPMTWYQRGSQELWLADALDDTSGGAMTVGFARYRKGETNDWTLSYDEVLVITKGAFTVEHAGGATSAVAGEVIYLRAGADVVYRADEDTELVYVTSPHWFEATQRSRHAAKLDEFHTS
ncbi:MAG: cupin [Acidimicrobiia bacterium]